MTTSASWRPPATAAAASSARHPVVRKPVAAPQCSEVSAAAGPMSPDARLATIASASAKAFR
jgi:hypothetical protein